MFPSNGEEKDEILGPLLVSLGGNRSNEPLVTRASCFNFTTINFALAYSNFHCYTTAQNIMFSCICGELWSYSLIRRAHEQNSLFSAVSGLQDVHIISIF